MKRTLYLETTIPSYLTALPSRDVIVLAHQLVTKQWWDEELVLYEVFISQVVLEEAGAGDREAATRRLEVLSLFPVLEITAEVEALAEVYIARMAIPERALRDALHLALASHHGVDYLLTWNCAHIAHGDVIRQLQGINSEQGIDTPVICTPEELLGGRP